MILKPRPLELYDQDFENACRLLAEQVAPFQPDLLVGIATGGAVVAEAMQPHLPSAVLRTVKVQRPGTAAKEALRLGSGVSRLPRRFADGLRWLEVEYREVTLRREVPADLQARAAQIAEDGELHTGPRFRRCVIIDDTIDSGRTMLLVQAAVALAQPQATVRTAVLASTWRRPPVRPDMCLFERTLLRLPWSLDARSAR